MKQYEIMQIYPDGHTARGGIKASMSTVRKWIEQNTANDPESQYIAVEADSEAITIAEYRAECRAYKLQLESEEQKNEH